VPIDPLSAPGSRGTSPAFQPSAPALPTPPHTTRTKRRHAFRSILFLILPICLAAGIYIYVTGGRYISTDDAYVSANIVAVSTDVSGIVKEVDVTDNQKVVAGQVLFKLDDLPFRLKLAQADGKLATVRDSIKALCRKLLICGTR